MLLCGIIQFGSVLVLHNNMVNAARETARRMAVDESFDAAQAQSYAETYLSDWNLNFSFAIVPPPGAPDVSVQKIGEHTSELQSLMRNSYAVLCLKKKVNIKYHNNIVSYFYRKSDQW